MAHDRMRISNGTEELQGQVKHVRHDIRRSCTRPLAHGYAHMTRLRDEGRASGIQNLP